MLTLGRVSDVAMWVWTQVILFGTLAFLFLPGAEALEIAELRLATILGGLLLVVWLLLRTMHNVSILDIIRTIVRPFFASIVMSVVVLTFGGLVELSILTMLILKIFLGILTYFVAVILMWWIAGKPVGAETYIGEKFLELLTKFRASNTPSR